MEFWPIFAAVLAANVCTGAIIWGAVTYRRMEKENRVEDIPRAVYISIFLPLIFLVLGLNIAL